MAKSRSTTESAATDMAAGVAAPAMDPKQIKKAEKAAKKAAKANNKAERADMKAAKASKKANKASQKSIKAGNKPPVATASTAKKTGLLLNPIRNLIITALVSILIGLAFIIKPVLVYSYSGYFIGGVLGLIGIVYIIIYFARRPVSGVYRSEFCIGLIALLVGAYVAFNGLLTDSSTVVSLLLSTIVKILGVAMVLDGILKLQYCLDLLRMRFSGWWLALIMAVVGIALGVVTVLGYVYPAGIQVLGTKADSGFASGMTALGAAFCLNGVLDFVVMISVAVRNSRAGKAEAMGGEDYYVPEEPAYVPYEAPAASAPVYQAAPQPQPVQAPVYQPQPSNEPAFHFEGSAAPYAAPNPAPQDVVLPEPELATPAPEDNA